MFKHSIYLVKSIILLLILQYHQAYAQKTGGTDKIIAQYDSVNLAKPKEKLYVNFDKSIYIPSDTIWFKAYLLDESLIKPSSQSGVIYAEMIDDNGEVMQSVCLPTYLGLTWGGFALDANIYKPGKYTFRAYTNWMQNIGEHYFFKKELKILNLDTEQQPSENKSTTSGIATKKPETHPLNRKEQNIDIQFLPEGGTWVAERTQKIAFKAINTVGKGIPIEGEIIDSKQNKITLFASNDKGMGYFNMIPKLDETYTAIIKKPNAIKSQTLPKAQQTGTTLQVNNTFSSDSLGITIYSDLINQELMLIGQSRGTLCFISKIKANTTAKTVKVSKTIFPTGISQIILLNANKQSLNERNFFINHKDELQILANSDKTIYGNRDSIPLRLKVTDTEGKPVVGSFSMAVTDDDQVEKDSINDNNILTYLLLTSDLKGEVENPGYYFNQPNEQKYNDLEALTLTQGWVSYRLQPDKNYLFKAEKDFTISGTVTNLLNKPSLKAQITLFGNIKKKPIILGTVANDKGEFVFDNLPSIDSASFVIQALNVNGKKGTLGITVNEFKRPPFTVSTKSNSVNYNQTSDSISANLIKTQTLAYQSGFKDGTFLKDVKIVGKKVIKSSKNLNKSGEADQTLTETDLNKIAKKSLLEVLKQKVKGFREGTRRKSFIRDFFVDFNLARFVFDGVELDFFYAPTDSLSNIEYYNYIKTYLDYYSAEDLKGIEVMSSSKYSGRYKSKFLDPLNNGDYAFIEITTKTGSGPFLKKSANMYIYKPQKYGDEKVFYNPKYTLNNKNNKKLDLRSTIYWAPNLLTNNKGEVNTSFFSADKKGTYTVWVEGTDMQGNFGTKTMKLKIN